MIQQIALLPIEKKIGQMLFIGLSGVEVNSETRKLLAEISPGGVCLFARNIQNAEQTRNFLNEIREALPLEPFLSLDQEGGLVDRLRRMITPMPSAASIQTVREAENLAEITYQLLRMLGFNMNFAPVVDVIDEYRGDNNNGLYSRAFGKTKEDSVELAGAYLNALQKGGCLGCIKHFPGLGASRTDSHEDLPIVNLNREELFATDLFPYQKLFKTTDVHVVMVAHASYPLFDLQETDVNGKLLPSSLSFKITNNLLREELGFQGLVISDDLEMGAILKNYEIGDACIMAVNAGVDMLSICADPDAVRKGFTAVVEAVKSGEIKEARIDESLSRIAQIKSLVQPPQPFDTARLEVLSREIAELNKKVNCNYGG
jgi:beta-N-acetylhexosaminidase